MFNDQIKLKEELKNSLIKKFGEPLYHDVLLLIEKISGIDTYIDENLLLKLQNLLPLSTEESTALVQVALTLSSASPVATILLLEKIPTLTFYDIVKEISDFLINIKNYGARAVALYLGSEQTNTLRVEDLVDVLEQSTLPFYKVLLNKVNQRHEDFGVCCAMIMRFAAKIESVIQPDEIDTYLNICHAIIQSYGAKIGEQYIRHSHELMAFCQLNEILKTIENFSKKSIAYVEFAVTFPKLLLTAQRESVNTTIDLNKCNGNDLKQIKIDLLKRQDYLTFLETPQLFEDKNYLSLMMNWPNLSKTVQSNMLFQLEQDNYKDYILSKQDVYEKRQRIDEVTQSHWLDPFMYCGEVIDLVYIRKRIGQLLQTSQHFSIEPKTIIKTNQAIFDRKNTEYTHSRALAMLQALLTHCIDETTK